MAQITPHSIAEIFAVFARKVTRQVDIFFLGGMAMCAAREIWSIGNPR
jgi:hypothetical protein